MQKKLISYLGKTYKRSKVVEEFALSYGTADIVMMNPRSWTAVEIKINPSNRLLEQAMKHKKIFEVVIAVSLKPSSLKTQKKWVKIFRDNGINLYWFEKEFKHKIKMRNKINKNLRNKLYGGTIDEKYIFNKF